ncbi:MAG TPA: lactate utilization protein [Spirochaetia bacterium]|nr:lactate utilization protein [Spirochaetia bacterium]
MSFDALASLDRIQSTVEALKARGIQAEIAENGAEALARIKALTPAGASVSTGASLTLKEIGFEDYLTSGAHPWKNLKGEYLSEKDPARQTLLRRQSVLADYFLGSAHGVAQTGEVVIASMTGSQLSPYAYAAQNVIWIVGAQKITATLEEAVRRVREYVLPHEDARMKDSTGGRMGSRVGKLMIFEHEAPFLNRKVAMIIVREKLGD